jgi:hypothetical protein
MFPSIPWLSQAQFASALILIAVAVVWKVLSQHASRNADPQTAEMDRQNAVSRTS